MHTSLWIGLGPGLPATAGDTAASDSRIAISSARSRRPSESEVNDCLLCLIIRVPWCVLVNILAPRILRLVTEQRASFVDPQQGAELADAVAQPHAGVALGQQLAAGPVHHRIGRGHDQRLGALDIGL